MSYVALCLTVALQAPAGHADLHDPQADLFFEVPDAQALLAAYDQAPLFQILADEDVHELLGGALGPKPMTTRVLADEIFGGVGLEPDDLLALSASIRVGGAGPIPFGFQLVADFAGASQATETAARFAARGSATQAPPGWAVPGVQVFEWPEMQGIPMWTVALDTRLVVGAGPLGPDGFKARMASPGSGLGATSAYLDARGALGPSKGATVMHYVQRRSPFELLARLNDTLGFLPSAALAQASGFDPFAGPMSLRMELVGDRFVTRIHQPDTSATAGVDILGKEELRPAWYADVPPGVMLLYATSVDGATLGGVLRENLVSESGEQNIGQLESLLDFRVDELFAQMGPGMVTYAFPIAGLGLPQTYSWVELRDADTFQTSMNSLAEILPQVASGFNARTRDYRVKNKTTGERLQIPVTTLALPQELLAQIPVPGLSPSYAIVDGKLLFGISTMHVKRELKRIYGGEPTPGQHPLESSGVTVPAGARSVLWMDWGALIDGAMSLVRNLGGLASGMMGDLPFDPAALPPSEIFTSYLEPTFHVSRRIEGATVRHHEASFGPETWLGLTAAGFAAFQFMEQQMGASRMGPQSGSVPAPSDAPGLAATTRTSKASVDDTRRTLQNIRTGLAIYNLDNGSYPDGLAVLTSPTESYPKGLLGAPDVPKDAWGNAFRYERTRDGKTYRLWSNGPNSQDEGGLGDDVTQN